MSDGFPWGCKIFSSIEEFSTFDLDNVSRFCGVTSFLPSLFRNGSNSTSFMVLPGTLYCIGMIILGSKSCIVCIMSSSSNVFGLPMGVNTVSYTHLTLPTIYSV